MRGVLLCMWLAAGGVAAQEAVEGEASEASDAPRVDERGVPLAEDEELVEVDEETYLAEEGARRTQRLVFGSLGSVGGAVVSGAVLGLAGAGIGYLLRCGYYCQLYTGAIGLYAGVAVGVPLGAFLVGRLLDGRGSFLATAGGAVVGIVAALIVGVAGVAATYGLYSSGNYAAAAATSYATIFVSAALPCVGSAIGFDLSDQADRAGDEPAVQVRIGLGSVVVRFG